MNESWDHLCVDFILSLVGLTSVWYEFESSEPFQTLIPFFKSFFTLKSIQSRYKMQILRKNTTKNDLNDIRKQCVPIKQSQY